MKAFLQFWNDCYLNLILPLHNLEPCDEDILKKLFSSFTSETGNREMLKFLPGELVDLGEGDLGLQWISISGLLWKGLVNRLGSAADVTRTVPLACVVWRVTFYCDGPGRWLEGTGLKIEIVLERQFKNWLPVVPRVELSCESGFQRMPAARRILVVLGLSWAELGTQKSKSEEKTAGPEFQHLLTLIRLTTRQLCTG